MSNSMNPVNLEQQSTLELNEIPETIDYDDLESNFIGSPSFNSGLEDEIPLSQAKEMDHGSNISAADESDHESSSDLFTQPTSRPLAKKQDVLMHSKPHTSEFSLSSSSKDVIDQISETPDSLVCYIENTLENFLEQNVSEKSDTMVFLNGISTQEAERLMQTNNGDSYSSIKPHLLPISKANDVPVNEKSQKKIPLETISEGAPPLPLIAKALARPHKSLLFQKELFIPQDDEAYTKVAEVYHKKSGLHVTKYPTNKGFNLISDKFKSMLPDHQLYKNFR